MADDIPNSVILEHIHAMKHDLQKQIGGLQAQITTLDTKVTKLQEYTVRGFELVDRRLLALEEDLVATMKMVRRHDVKLARMEG
jgi:prefoldin subunit 5